MTVDHLVTVYGTSVMICTPDGAPLGTDKAATDVVGEALGQRVEVVVIPVERLTDDFFDLKTGVAGEIVQKFSNYHLRVAVIGDITQRLEESSSLSAWVAESNRGTQVMFCPTFDGLKERLDRRKSSAS